MIESFQSPADGPSCNHIDNCDHALHAGVSEACYNCTGGNNFKQITDPDFLPDQPVDADVEALHDAVEAGSWGVDDEGHIEKRKPSCSGCGSPVGEAHGESCPVYLKKMEDHKKQLSDMSKTIANTQPFTATPQVGGDHYRGSKKVETWDLYELGMTDEEFRGAMKNNIIKYLDRYRQKNGVQDLKKLQSYGKRLEAFEEGRRMVAFPINIHKAADGKYSASELLELVSAAVESLLTKVVP